MVRVARRYRAEAQRVFDAWIDPAIAGRWLFATATRPMTHVDIDARIAGTFRFAERRNEARVEYAGEYVALAAPWHLAFTLLADRGADAAMLVKIEIEPQREGCRLALAHEHVPADRVALWKARWTGILYGLGETLAPAPLATPARENRAAIHGGLLCITC